MTRPRLWGKVLVVIGTIGLFIGTIDPLEGSVLILAGIILITVAVFMGGSKYRTLLLWSLVLTTVGVTAMWIISGFGGVGGDTGRSLWWLVPIVTPYALGWLLGVIGMVLVFREFFSKNRTGKGAAHTSGIVDPST